MFWKETPDYQNVLGNSFPWGPAAQKCIKRHMKSTKRKHDASTACSPTHHQQDDDPPPRPRPRPWHVLKEAEADELKMRHSSFYIYLSLSLSLSCLYVCVLPVCIQCCWSPGCQREIGEIQDGDYHVLLTRPVAPLIVRMYINNDSIPQTHCIIQFDPKHTTNKNTIEEIEAWSFRILESCASLGISNLWWLPTPNL